MEQKLIEYNLSSTRINDKSKGQLLTYELAGNGIFVHAERELIKATIPITQCEVRGLPTIERKIWFDFPHVPVELVMQIQEQAEAWARVPLESVWHLIWSPVYPYYRGWELIEPDQMRSATSCRPLVSGQGNSHERAIIEIHSHHSMPAKFSAQDDKDETGFRIYGVIGDFNNFNRVLPAARFRLGVYGYFASVKPEFVMDCEGIWEEA